MTCRCPLHWHSTELSRKAPHGPAVTATGFLGYAGAVQGGESRSSAIFAGALISEVKAAGVPASATFEAFIELQLAISSEEVLSVAHAFERMTRPEMLHGAPPTPDPTHEGS